MNISPAKFRRYRGAVATSIRRPTSQRWLIWILFIALLTACGDDEVATSKAKTTVKKVTPTPDSVAPAAEGSELTAEAPQWTYSPIGKRDPFRSYLAEMAERSPGHSKRKEETEMYELDQYHLTALITATAQPKAMVEDPTGKGHVLGIGARLGKNGGRVTRITATGIVVTEEFRAPTGERVRVPITIPLRKPDLDLVGEP